MVLAVIRQDAGANTDYVVGQGAGAPTRVFFASDAATGTGPGFYDGVGHAAWGTTGIAAITDVWAALFDVSNRGGFSSESALYRADGGVITQFGTDTSFTAFGASNAPWVFGSQPDHDASEIMFLSGLLDKQTQDDLIQATNYKWALDDVAAAPVLPGIKSWDLSAQEFVGESDGVTQQTWTSRHVGAETVTQATASERPTKQTVSGEPVLRFDGTADNYDAGAGFDMIDELSYFVVFKGAAGITGSDYLFDGAANNTGISMRNNNGALEVFAGTTLASTIDPDYWMVAEIHRDPLDNGEMIVDGVEVANGAMGANGQSQFGMAIGRFWNGGSYHNGDIAELVAYEGRLTGKERARVREWLQMTWAAVLP
jgi:hypothetical protein